MNDPAMPLNDERVLILVPTPKDASVTMAILAQAGLQAHVCSSVTELCDEAERGAGVGLLTEEAIAGDHRNRLAGFLSRQPAWSDFPLVVLTRAGLDPHSTFPNLSAIGKMILVNRPVQIATLVSTLEAAVRDRKRQYALREHLAHRDLIEQQLKAADRRKDEFLALLAHELRNPLAPIAHAVELLGMSGIDEAAREQTRQIMREQVAQMTHLIDDLLDVSRITQGKIQLKIERFDLCRIVKTAADSMQSAFAQAEQEFTCSTPDRPLLVDADPTRLAQIIVNILTNACKYTPKLGRISLTADHDHNSALVRVKDNGVGIPLDKQAEVFETFVQLDQSIERGQVGLGLGLALVKKLVEMHGGSVAVASGGSGLGSDFEVRLPLAQSPPIDDAATCPQSNSNNDTGFRVLVVDDSHAAAQMFAVLLRKMGHQVEIARDGIEALQFVETSTPEVIFSDISMPKLSGYELARRLRERPELQRTFLVAITGYGQEEDRARVQQAGFDSHLVKPAGIEELNQLFQQFVNLKAERTADHNIGAFKSQ